MDAKSFFSFTYNRVLATAALVMLVAALGAYAYFTLRQAEYMYTGPVTISVTGEGEVLAVPDIGQFSFSVTAKAATAAEAQSLAAEANNKVLGYLKEQGVAEKDIKTEQYSLYPHYRYEEQPCPFGVRCPGGQQVEDGFEVSQSMLVKVRDLNKAGELMSGAGERGATNISGLSFTIDNDDKLKEEARALAITDAQTKAKVLAEELGVRLVRMTGYYENNGEMPMYGYGGDMKSQAAVPMMEGADAPEVPTGEQSTKSRVTLTFIVR